MTSREYLENLDMTIRALDGHATRIMDDYVNFERKHYRIDFWVRSQALTDARDFRATADDLHNHYMNVARS